LIVVIVVPPIPDRYYTFEFLDAYTNDFAYVGTRATGAKAKNKPLGYASLVVGGFGVIVLLLISFTPIVTYL